MTIIEDTISRNKKFREERQRRVSHLKKLKAPAALIEHEEFIAKMTVAEYKLYCEEQENLRKQEIAEYAKNNSLKKEIVDEIYNRVENLEYDFFKCLSNLHFIAAIDPLEFMSKEDYDNELYETFLAHASEIYRKKFEKEYLEDEIKKQLL